MVRLNPQQRKNLSNVLSGITDEEEKDELSVFELLSTPQVEEPDVVPGLIQKLIETHTKNTSAILEGLKNLAGGLKQQDWSGFFKDFPTMLSQIGTNTGQTSELIRNLKWNASQQLRDVNSSPINPAIAPFGITMTYDDIVLGYTGSNLTSVTYKQNGNIKAVLALSYDGSNNLIEVQRTT